MNKTDQALGIYYRAKEAYQKVKERYEGYEGYKGMYNVARYALEQMTRIEFKYNKLVFDPILFMEIVN